MPRVLLGLASIGWLATMVLPLTMRGNGSTLPGHALADLASSGRLPGVPSWLGTAWYLTPLGGATVLASLGFRGRPASAVRLIAAALATTSAIAFTVLVTDLDVSRFGTGSWSAIAGSGLATCALGGAIRQHARDRRAHHVLQ